jgi:hypothetical protein
MNYGHILSKSWQIVSKNKVLWLLGFFAALVVGGSKSSLGNDFVTGSSWLFQNLSTFLITHNLTTLLSLALSVGFWLTSTVARIALVREVATVDTLQPKSVAPFGKAVRSATKAILPILLMQLVVWLPVLAVDLVLSRVGRPMSEAFLTNAQTGAPTGSGFSDSFGVVCGGGIGLTILILLSSFVDAFAFRSILLEKIGVFQGIKHALTIMRVNAKPILILSLICLVIGMIVSFVIGLVLMPLARPILTPMVQNLSQCTLQQDYRAMLICVQQHTATPTIIAAGFALSVVAAILSALWVAFQSATFTLAYSRFARID